MNSVTTDNPQCVEEFIERMGLSTESDGLPRIAGRMWGFFIIHGGPCSFAELAERLQVSRGSISTNARILRDLGIIERVSLPGDRQDYYRLTDNPYDRLLEGYVARMKQMLGNVSRTLSGLPADWHDTEGRLQEMQHFYKSAVHSTEILISELREASAATQPQITTTAPLLKQSS